jgi:hypothetical protein
MHTLVGGLMVVMVLAGAGCSTTGTEGTSNNQFGCSPETPDAGVCAFGGGLCSVGWTCDSDTSHFAISCVISGSEYECTCCTEGQAVRTFKVAPFACDPNIALGAANAGCGLTIQ